MPVLPNELHSKYTKEFKLSEYDALQLTETKELAEYYNEAVKDSSNFKGVANWIMGPVKSYINENAIHFSDFRKKVEPYRIAEVVQLVDKGMISGSTASQVLFPEMIKHPGKNAEDLAKELDIVQNSNSNDLQELINKALEKFPEKIIEYKNGKTGLLGLFVGEVMKLSKGKADPKLLNNLVKETLEK